MVAHAFQDVGRNKEVQDQQSHRFLTEPTVTLLLGVAADSVEMATHYIMPTRAGAEALKRLSTKTGKAHFTKGELRIRHNSSVNKA
jgi:hypothetical protein